MRIRPYIPFTIDCVVVGALILPTGGSARSNDGRAPSSDSAARAPSSGDVLARLPDGETKRRFILDCTGCHQMDAQVAYPGGRARTVDEWHAAVERMLGYAGASTPFPVIAADREPAATARWLAEHLPATPPTGSRDAGAAVGVREYMLPVARDLPHDLQVLADGRVLITGMMTDRMYVLSPDDGRVEEIAIPVERANPRAVELAANGDWWVLLGAANKVARYRPASGEWQAHDIGLYAHSIGLDSAGGVWYNGHFTKDPEVLGRLDAATGRIETLALPLHPTMAKVDGGPIPYELRVGPDGRLWMSELQGNRIVSFDPATRAFATYMMPTSASGPRRLDVDARGIVWIPAYADNALVRLDPATGGMRSFTLPVEDAVPYVARVDGATQRVWLGTSAADAVFVFDPATEEFHRIALPSRGAMVRHMAIDAKRGDVWLAYGASPGIAARVARVRIADALGHAGVASRGRSSNGPAEPTAATQAADSAAIRAAALDYIEGWYTGDAARMRRAVHPDLAKRIVVPRRGAPTRLSANTTAELLVAQTEEGGGRDTPDAERRRDVRILDVFGNAASVRIDARDWIDYLHLGKIDGRWVIVNVLWEMRPRG